MTSPPRPRHRAAALALALTAVLALGATACGADTSATKTSTGTSSSAVKDGTAVTTLDGSMVTLPGGKPAALFFFSVGCGECAGGAKSLNEAAQGFDKSGKKADFLAVDMDPGESKQTIVQFLGSIKAPTLPAAIDKDATLSRRYQVSALSTLIVIDTQGKVTYRATDPSAEKITAALEKAGAK